ncbi:hypothetical protein DUNSADRAFT_13338 [Dunaliella salina]|uniref:Uncharacterized protein n=1 Tax=Dunaliella salina TaxID=3046 RepID=A0ABQ7G9K9_DUNSA|nr:hypothetical protein DUNSADRAFT_13338 [Dunaliella salina]|eukprot:KAF5831282.1 hypothetical protein DUNSADRAFT_13338 [Dunaliella salina]
MAPFSLCCCRSCKGVCRGICSATARPAHNANHALCATARPGMWCGCGCGCSVVVSGRFGTDCVNQCCMWLFVQVWEQATVAVMQRESVLDTLLLVQKGVEEGSIGYLTISAIERQCVQLVQLTACVEQLKRVLGDKYAVELTFHGQPYPGSQQPSIDQLLEFMEWLRDSSDSVVCLS